MCNKCVYLIVLLLCLTLGDLPRERKVSIDSSEVLLKVKFR
jgi:hypothetical protein